MHTIKYRSSIIWQVKQLFSIIVKPPISLITEWYSKPTLKHTLSDSEPFA